MKFFKVILAVLITVFFLSCKKNISVNNLNGDKIGCFGHAGMGTRSIYLANTFESFHTCLGIGADGTEMDIQVTKDGVLVIFHDDNLSGITECGGVIRDLNWNEISSCRFSSTLLQNLNVISFDEFIKKIHDPHRYTYTFDCKITEGSDNNDGYYQRFASTIVKTIEKYGLQQNIFIENSDPDFLNHIKSSNSELKLFLLGDDYDSTIKSAFNNDFYGISMASNKMSRDQITEAHAKGIRVTLYGVETNKQNIAAVEKQPDFIQTDDLDYLLRIFGKYHRNKGMFHSLLKSL